HADVSGAAAPPTAARRLARFVVGLDLDQIPAPVVTQATGLLLDTLGNGLAASREDFGRAVLGVAERLGGPPESALIGRRARVAAANAVLANATLAHGLDFDDTREGAIVHTGCVAVTTALAVGEAVGATGRAVVEALVAGVEVMCRVGLAVPGALHARHFHPTAVAGVFGAAAAAGKLHGLGEDQLVHAFGICGSQAGGIIEYLADGSWSKRLHPGWAAHGGVVATLLARSGFTGPATVLEGPHGLYQAFAGGHDAAGLETLLASLGRVWELAELTLKPYPCGSIAQPYMDAALRLRERHGIRPEAVAEVRCRTAPGPVPRLWEPLAAKHAPPNGYAAKFSLPYLVAVILVKGRAGLAEFSDEAARDPAVLRVAARVTYELDASIDYPRRFVGDVEVRLADGRVVRERQARPRGGPAAPLSRDELEAKFRGNAALALPATRAEELIRGVSGLAGAPGLADLVASLSP
ncbi:MAG: MmgE/PrpD family protein, partial [Candidatus Rokubacteria bacterium]|nr:MmgE/PrpD family protein [Candidatus Rokubacteria bacterium]